MQYFRGVVIPSLCAQVFPLDGLFFLCSVCVSGAFDGIESPSNPLSSSSTQGPHQSAWVAPPDALSSSTAPSFQTLLSHHL